MTKGWLFYLLLVVAVPQSWSADKEACFPFNVSTLKGYDSGGVVKLEHFVHTTGRAKLRSFLWEHLRAHRLGYVIADARTVDAGIVRTIYVVRPDSDGTWGIDAQIQRPVQKPHCSMFHADTLMRVPVRKGAPDYPDQTLELWLPGGLPKNGIKDYAVVDSNAYRLILVAKNKPIGGTI